MIMPVAVTLNCCADAGPMSVREAAIRSRMATLADDRRETTGERRVSCAGSFQKAGNNVGLAWVLHGRRAELPHYSPLHKSCQVGVRGRFLENKLPRGQMSGVKRRRLSLRLKARSPVCRALWASKEHKGTRVGTSPFAPTNSGWQCLKVPISRRLRK